MHNVCHHTRPPPFPIAGPKNAHLSGRSGDLDPWPRVSLGSRFFLTHPMLPGATVMTDGSSKYPVNKMILQYGPSYVPPQPHMEHIVNITGSSFFPVLRLSLPVFSHKPVNILINC